MKDELLKNIKKAFENKVDAVLSVCETEIEKIFLLKIINWALNRPDRCIVSFIFEDTEIIKEDNYSITLSPRTNYYLPEGFGRLSGIRLESLIKSHYLEIYPQFEITFRDSGNLDNLINYRLDFAVHKFKSEVEKNINTTGKNPVTKYCIECDGYEFHNSSNQIKKDNERDRILMFHQQYFTQRFLGTEIYNLDEKKIGAFLWNL